MDIEIKIKKSYGNYAKFDIKNVDASIVNAVRRVILSEVFLSFECFIR